MSKAIALHLFLLISTVCASDCPSDTFLRTEFCKSIASKNDTDRINLFIMLIPQDDSGRYTTFNEAKEWSNTLFEKYDLKNCDNERVSTLPDSEIRWDYRLLSTTKAEAISILKEPFIAQLSLMEEPAGCNDFGCPGPKYDGVTCDSLQIKTPTSYFAVTINFYRLWHMPPCYSSDKGGSGCPETESDPANKKLLKQWTEDLFSKYDLRLFGDSSISAPTPSDNELYWSYGPYKATAKSITDLVKEQYVYKATIWDRRNLPTARVTASAARSRLKHGESYYYINGRTVNLKNNVNIKHWGCTSCIH